MATTATQLPVVHAQATSPNQPSGHARQKNKDVVFRLGVAEVIIGVITIVLAIVAVYAPIDDRYFFSALVCTYYSRFYSGVWCGVFAAITGGLAITLKKKTTRALYIANMVVAIFAANAMLGGVGISGWAAASSHICSTMRIAMHACVALVCFVLFVILVVHASLCCRGACYQDSVPPPTQVLYVHQQGTNVKQSEHGLPVYAYDNPAGVH